MPTISDLTNINNIFDRDETNEEHRRLLEAEINQMVFPNLPSRRVIRNLIRTNPLENLNIDDWIVAPPRVGFDINFNGEFDDETATNDESNDSSDTHSQRIVYSEWEDDENFDSYVKIEIFWYDEPDMNEVEDTIFEYNEAHGYDPSTKFEIVFVYDHRENLVYRMNNRDPDDYYFEEDLNDE